MYVGRFLKSLRKKFQDKLAEANNVAEETISNIRTVRSFSNESKMNRFYERDINKSYRLGRTLGILIGMYMYVRTYVCTYMHTYVQYTLPRMNM